MTANLNHRATKKRLQTRRLQNRVLRLQFQISIHPSIVHSPLCIHPLYNVAHFPFRSLLFMETYPQTRWDLSALLRAPSGEPVDRALADIETRTAHFEQARARLKSEIDEEEFLDLVQEFEGLNRELRKIG